MTDEYKVLPLASYVDNPHGLHKKYNVTHVDDKPIDPNAVYFVLRLDGNNIHSMASRLAAEVWAAYAKGDPKLLLTALDLEAVVKELRG